jgi:hypothetical protein
MAFLPAVCVIAGLDPAILWIAGSSLVMTDHL